MRPVETKLLLERHRMMLEYQKIIYPFVPHSQELCTLWKLAARSQVTQLLRRMAQLGLAVSRETPTKMIRTEYYAIEKEIE